MIDDDDDLSDKPDDAGDPDVDVDCPECRRMLVLVARRDWAAAHLAIDDLKRVSERRKDKPHFVAEIGLSTRAVSMFATDDIETCEQLCSASRMRLRLIRSVADVTIAEAYQRLIECGHEPKWDVRPWPEVAIDELVYAGVSVASVKTMRLFGCKTIGDVAYYLWHYRAAAGRMPDLKRIRSVLSMLGVGYKENAS